MCGIAGLLLAPGREVSEAQAEAASRALAHRGPDDLGFLGWSERGGVKTGRDPGVVVGGRVALIHRRLAILDLSPLGWQPMSAAGGGGLHLAFNGEIYNFLELRSELERLGHRFRSNGDTEVLLAALAEWGSAALLRLVGMFALALVDLRSRKLLLARDFFGIKPLYYAQVEGGLAFASEIRALRELTGAAARADPRRLYDYLRFGTVDHRGETMFAGVHQLPPAHLLEVALDRPEGFTPQRYWQPGAAPRSDLGFEEAAGKLRDLFLDNVRLHLRSDVPVGAALSGGIDSSSIVMAMRHLVGERLDLRAFSYAADDPELSEASWVELVGAASGAKVTWARASPGDLANDLEALIDVQDEPFASPSIYAQYRVFQAARAAGVKVMLDGQGADEVLGGYRSFLSARLASMVRRGRIGEALRFAVQAARLPGFSLGELLIGLGTHLTPPAARDLARRLVDRDLFPKWLDHAWFRERGALASPLLPTAGREAAREQAMALLERASLPQLLRYEDRNSMAFSIESRVPFLTPALVDFLLALPEEYLVAGDGTSKAVFRRAMRGIVPDAILDRRDKIGFATPDRRWLAERRDWVEAILDSDAARAIPAWHPDRARAEWEAILAGRRPYDSRVWRWINLVRWTARFGVAY